MTEYENKKYQVGKVVLEEYQNVHISNLYYMALQHELEATEKNCLTEHRFVDENSIPQSYVNCTRKECGYYEEKLMLIKDGYLNERESSFTLIPVKFTMNKWHPGIDTFAPLQGLFVG